VLTPAGHGYTRVEIAEIQRGRLMDAIVQVCDDVGYEGAGIKAICSRAGVSPPTFYAHYRGKEELFLAAYDSGVALVFAAAGEAYLSNAELGWEGRIEAGLGALLGALSDNPAFARFFLVEIHKAGPTAERRVEAALEASYRMFTDVEPVEGMPTPNPEMVPLLVGGIYTRLVSYVRAGRANRLRELVPVLVEFSLAVYGRARAQTINLSPPTH
jgi:AcrR family transcriptional regulator